MKTIYSILIIFFSINSFANPSEILCVNTLNDETLQKIQFIKIKQNLYETYFYNLNNDLTLSKVNVNNSRKFTLRNEVIILNSLDVVVEFDIVSKESPSNKARIRLLKQRKNLKNWLCKVYF